MPNAESTIAELAEELAAGETTSEALVEDVLRRISDPAGEGAMTYREVDASGAREVARAMDALRRAKAEPSPYAGIPVSVKDLFDVRGQVTRAGSRVLGKDGKAAVRDAGAVSRWRRAGLVVVGRTNMTEFAFSGVGINPHYGTPANPWDRASRRIPGGSSSGAAVSVADGMSHGALGTDTGGSCRIPASLCGLVGFKPTQAMVARDGVVPLSPTLDTVGVLARTVGCCAALFGLLADCGSEPSKPLSHPPRLAVVRDYFLADADEFVTMAFERTCATAKAAGAELVELKLPELAQIAEINALGGFPAAESFAWHHDLIAAHAGEYDPRVLSRIRRGEQQSARDLLVLAERRAQLIDSTAARLRGFDAFLCPTVPIVAPPIDALADDDEYTRMNQLMLRNPTVVNLLDGCAVSVPMHAASEPPAGLTVAGVAFDDAQVLAVAAWIEEHIRKEHE